MRVSVKTKDFPEIEQLPTKLVSFLLENAIYQYIQTNEAQELIKLLSDKKYFNPAHRRKGDKATSIKKEITQEARKLLLTAVPIKTNNDMADSKPDEVAEVDDNDIMGDFK